MKNNLLSSIIEILDSSPTGDQIYLMAGGAAGHMLHPYDKYTDPKDFLNFFKDFLTGKIEGTEKVDGYNLFVGYNENGEVVASRNKNQPPIKNIAGKFGVKHGAFAGFVSGWKAIKSKLEQLSENEKKKYNLIDEEGTPKNFINLEILFGYIPNVVPYSQSTNYIVFHGYTGTPENDWEPQDTENEEAKLRALAKKLGEAAVFSSEVIFHGEPGDVKQSRKSIESYWQFKGPIGIKKEDIKSQLEKVAKEWKNYPEVKQLEKTTDPGKQFDLMKSVTKKIGSKVLQTMVSKLSETGKIVAGHPGMEGIVLKRNGEKVKITGDFLDYSKPEDVPTVDVTRNLREFIQKEILGLTTITLSRIPEKSISGVHDYILSKRRKAFKYDLDQEIPDEYINEIKETIEKAQHNLKQALKKVREKGREYDERDLLVQSFMLSKFKDDLKKADTYEDVVDSYARTFFNIKRE
jgi:hypothetical protein